MSTQWFKYPEHFVRYSNSVDIQITLGILGGNARFL